MKSIVCCVPATCIPFLLCTEDTASNGRKVSGDLTCMSEIEFGFDFDWL